MSNDFVQFFCCEIVIISSHHFTSAEEDIDPLRYPRPMLGPGLMLALVPSLKLGIQEMLVPISLKVRHSN